MPHGQKETVGNFQKMIRELKKVNLTSSYTHQFGVVMYEEVLKYRPKTIHDIGVLNGFSTAYLTMAAKEIGANVVAIDLFELYEYNSVSQEQFEDNMDALGLMDTITVQKMSVYDWLDLNVSIEFVHLDIANTGKTLMEFFNRVTGNPVVLFEGGWDRRDNQDWMLKYNKKKIIPTLNENDISFELLYNEVVEVGDKIQYPSLSKVVL